MREIKFSYLNQNTNQFIQPVLINAIFAVKAVHAPFPITDRDGYVYIFYLEQTIPQSSTANLKMIKMNQGGTNKLSEEIIISDFSYTGHRSGAGLGLKFGGYFGPQQNEFRVNSYPVAALDVANNIIYLVWSQNENASEYSDIYLAKYYADTGNWEYIGKINSEEGVSQEFFPYVWINNLGEISIVYYSMDNRESYEINTRVLFSDDGATSFRTIELNEYSFAYQLTNWEFGYFIGDYNALASTDHIIIPAWTTNIDYRQQILSAFIPKNIPVKMILNGFTSGYISIDNQDKFIDSDGETYGLKPIESHNFSIIDLMYDTKKFRNWNTDEYGLSRNEVFNYESNNPEVNVFYEPTHPLTVTNNLEGGSSGDPYEITWQNASITENWQYGNDYNAFENQSPNFDLYTIKALSINNQFGTNWTFLNWNTGSTDDEIIDIKIPDDVPPSGSFIANYKGNLASNQTDAITNNSQRKIIRDGNGIYHAVYTSMDKLWYTKSLTTDFNGNWTQEEQINWTGDPFDEFIYTNPSIDNYGNTLAVVCEVYETDSRVYLFVIDMISGSKTHLTSIDIDNSNKGNANPVVFYSNLETFILYKKSLFGELKYTRRYKITGGGWSGWEESSLPYSTSFSKNPSIIGRNSNSNMHIVWQEANAQIRYWYAKKKSDGVIEFHSFEVISSGNGYSVNEFPSISLNLNSIDPIHPIVSWRGGRKEKVASKVSNKVEGLVWVHRMITLPGTFSPDSVTWGNFYVTGNDVGIANNNSTSGSSAETVIAWSESNGAVSKWLRRTGTNYSVVEDLSHNGNQIQISNGSTLSTMKALVLSGGNPPYILQRTTTAFQGLGKISATGGPTYSRTGVVYKNSLEFVFNIGDILLNGENVLFVERADTLPIASITMLNEALNTTTFSLNPNSELLFSNYYYVVNPELADSLLTEDDEVTFMVQLVNAGNNQVVGTFDEVTYNKTNVVDYDNINYTVDCSGIEDGNYYFRLVTSVEGNSLFFLSNVQNDAEYLGKKNYTDVSFDGTVGPKTYELSQNYPNPFNPSTTINYQIPANGNVTLKIYDILGREVTTLVDEFKTEGRYEVNFSASSFASGVYLYRLRVNDYVDVKKMILLK